MPRWTSKRETLADGHVVIASITSCTNTSNPALMMAAGLLARNAAALGLRLPPWVRTSLAPGSRVVTGYLSAAGVLRAFEALRFPRGGVRLCHLHREQRAAARDGLTRHRRRAVVAAVLSGNRNFEARIHPLVRANYLASPPSGGGVRARGHRGRRSGPRSARPRSSGQAGLPPGRVAGPGRAGRRGRRGLRPEMFANGTPRSLEGDDAWRGIPRASGRSLRVGLRVHLHPGAPLLGGLRSGARPAADVRGARVLALLGDSITTDHISPAGSIAEDGPAGLYLQARGVAPADFNTYGSRRGNHQVLMRGTFCNPRLRNRLVERDRRRFHPPLPFRRHPHHLRGFHALPGGGRTSGGAGRQGVRQRQLARLGGQGDRSCWACGR